LIDNFKNALSLVQKDHWVALSDQDDIWLPQKLELLIKSIPDGLIKSEKPVLIYSDLKVIDEHDQIMNNSFWKLTGRYDYEHCLETAIYGNFVSGCTTLMNPALIEYAHDIPQGLRANHDAWLAMIAMCFGEAIRINEPLVLYRQHNRNVTFSNRVFDRLLRTRGVKNIQFLLNKSNFLRDAVELGEKFVSTYHTKLSNDQKVLFNQLFELKDLGYFGQRQAVQKIFAPFWHRNQ
jgi:hypothetical protein